MPNTTHYSSNYYDAPLSANYNNVVTRRLAVRDWVGFGPSQRFGGQQYEQKAVPLPFHGTIMDTVGAIQQLINELNLSSSIIPDLGIPVILSQVGVATNILNNNLGVGVSYIGAVLGTVGAGNTNVTVDGIGFTTGLRVLYYGLSTASINGVYTVSFGTTYTSQTSPVYYLSRSSDLSNWWQFVMPKVYLTALGTTNAGKTFALTTDAWQIGNTFTIALGQNVAQIQGTSINFALGNYSPGIGTTTTSLIYPPYNVASNYGGYDNTGEYDFLSNDSLTEFMYIKNKAHRLAYRLYKMREQYSPFVSSYGNNIVTGINSANYVHNIGFSTFNDLPPQSRYPSSFNRGW